MDLTTNYLGLELRSPLISAAAAPLSEDLDNIKRLADAGAGAIVLHSLFEEQLMREKFELHHHLEYGTESFAEALTYFPEPDEFHVGPELYLEHIASAKAATGLPIIASLNGYSRGGWVEYARRMEEAGASAIELNVYFVPTDFNFSASDTEQIYLDILQDVKAEVNIPIAMKLSPFFTNMAYMAKRCAESGANGLVLFNRFLQPEISPEELEVQPQVHLSHSADALLAVRWIAILYGRIGTDFAATGGIHTGRDVIKALMAGAKTTQICSALLRHGIDYLRDMERQLQHWMTEHEYASVKEMQGTMSQFYCADESAYERAQYMRLLQETQPLWHPVSTTATLSSSQS
ncbi:MAG: dihydroorotate dehydrogenase-like protein [Cyanobacteria bacterium]|jgi:dihydroorotate dehydrogenase (fumarate)|nr:dihydroorotate dehydrogenase-like protein [Cyanobacteria bacterium GSL.Bin1]